MYETAIYLIYGLYLCLSYTMVRRERGRSDLDDDVSNVGWLMLVVTSVVGFVMDSGSGVGGWGGGVVLVLRQVCVHLVASRVGLYTSRYLIRDEN